jgi:tetratricopeptide (TPR) repeat protein
VLRERARVRARERFPGEGEAFVEAEVAEFMEMIAGEGGMPVVGDPAVDQGTEDWERQFAGLAIAGESIARSMAGRGEERMERSALRGFSEALAGLDGSGEWASGDVSALPVLGDADDEAVLVAGDGLEGESHPDAWTQQFVAGAGAGAVGATGLESAHGDTFNADLYEYLGRDPATVGYEFAPLDGNRYASLSAREALQEGIRLRNAGELSRAVQALETAAAAGKLDKEQSARAWYLLGTTHAECDDDERAIQAFLRCIGARNVGETTASASSAATVPPVDNPYRSGALLALGVCYTNELNTPKALSHVREWLDSREPGRGGALPVSDIWRSSPAPPADGVEREHRLLLARLERADREDPGDVDVSIAMGVLYNLSRQYELAARAMRMAVTLRPDDARLWNKLGATLANGNESDDALRAYRKAVDLSPSFIRAWVNVGTAYANRSDFDKAARYYLKALSMHADDQEQRSSASAGGAGPSAAPPSGGGLAAYVGDSEMVHVWGYLRTTLVAMQREDLLPLVESGNTDAFKPYVLF